MDRIEATEELWLAHAGATSAQVRLLRAVAECDHEAIWERDGCRDFHHWLSASLGISNWAARRWANASRKLPHLPETRAALENGTICFDKALELCRFATGDTEAKLLKWARRVTLVTVRQRADLETKKPVEEVVETDRTRYVRYWWQDEGQRLGLWGSFPAEQGHRLIKGLEQMAASLPVITTYESVDGEVPFPDTIIETRRADALVALVAGGGRGGRSDAPVDFVVHTDLAALAGHGNCEVEDGPVLHAETARRLSCDARLRTVLHDPSGRTVGIGRASRLVPDWLMTQLKHRDRGCSFDGCEHTRYLHAHHIVHWSRGGQTDLNNLVLVCTWHHKLVHEYRWGVRLNTAGVAEWFTPEGRRFDPIRSKSSSTSCANNGRASPREGASSPRAAPTCRNRSRPHSPIPLPSL